MKVLGQQDTHRSLELLAKRPNFVQNKSQYYSEIPSKSVAGADRSDGNGTNVPTDRLVSIRSVGHSGSFGL